jgi:hypothetical protein
VCWQGNGTQRVYRSPHGYYYLENGLWR